MRLPLGCRFVPIDLELIQYLSDKVKGRPDPGQGLIADDVDVYANSPQQLLSDASSKAIGRDGKLFYFTPIKFWEVGARCRNRSTPHGYWRAMNRRSEVHDAAGKLVGFVTFVQNFIYFHGKTRGARTKWMMKEYTLSANDYSNVALCVIHSTRDKFNKPDKKINTSDGGEGSRSASGECMMKECTLSASDYSNVALCVIHSTPDKFNKPDKKINTSDGGEGSGSANVVSSACDMDAFSYFSSPECFEPVDNFLPGYCVDPDLETIYCGDPHLGTHPQPVSGSLESFNNKYSLLENVRNGRARVIRLNLILNVVFFILSARKKKGHELVQYGGEVQEREGCATCLQSLL